MSDCLHDPQNFEKLAVLNDHLKEGFSDLVNEISDIGIRTNYLEANGKLMVEFGKKLSKAHELCEAANIRYEDYLDRVLRISRSAASSITKVASVPVNPAIVPLTPRSAISLQSCVPIIA